MALERGGNLRWVQRSRCAVAFVHPALLAFLLLFSLVISFGRACAVCPSVARIVVSGGCYINIAGRKPISVTISSQQANEMSYGYPDIALVRLRLLLSSIECD